MVEWSIALALKARGPKGSVGSNPTPSATLRTRMNDTAIVTCFYTGLYGSKYGGRLGRESHYLHSLASLLKITNADFFIYCDPEQEAMLKEYVEPLARSQVTIVPQSLEEFYMKDLFDQYKNFTEAESSQRCQEIQYLKSCWMSYTQNYDWVFWFDIGISYSGLLPDKYMLPREDDSIEYYNSSLICDELVEGLKRKAADKFLLMAINNVYPATYRLFVDEYYPKQSDSKHYHVIAGILGGRRNKVERFHSMFNDLAIEVTEHCKEVYDEESIYQILWDSTPEFFNVEKFECWWHEDNAESIYGEDHRMIEVIKSLRSFYKVLEDLIEAGK